MTGERAELSELSGGLWLYASALPPALERAFDAQLRGEAPSRNQDFERYAQWPHREARWLYRHARRLCAQLWEALCVSAELELSSGLSAPELLSFVQGLSEQERAQLLSGLQAELQVSPWPEELKPSALGLPPMRYEIELRPASYLKLYLSPILHLAITRLDQELGRSIGDALDGPRGG